MRIWYQGAFALVGHGRNEYTALPAYRIVEIKEWSQEDWQMTVRELIAILQTKPQDIQVVFSQFSEWALLEADQIEVQALCAPRGDGWVHDARPDKPTQDYLTFPGN